MEQNVTTIRNRIGDAKKTEIERFSGNGTVTAFTIQHKNPFNMTINVGGTELTDDDFTYDPEIDKVILNTAPEQDQNVIIKYNWSAFTDDEITGFLNTNGGNLDKATVEALRQLVGNQSRMVTFQQGDRSVSMSDIFANLMDLLNYYEKLVTNAGANSGSGFSMGKRVMDDSPRPQRNNDLSRLIGYED